MNNQFVFVVPAYNCEEEIHQTILSVISQSYSSWRMVLYDDMSTDSTPQRADDISKAFGLGDRLQVVSRNEKFGEVRNTLDAVSSINDSDIVCRLDGGDWLTDLDTLAIINHVYNDSSPAVLWTKQRWAFTTQNISGPLSGDNIDVYKHPWVSSHLKTFRKDAINNINIKNFKDDDDKWIMIGCDQAVFLPMLHKAGLEDRPRLFLPMVCYHYNINLSNPELFTCDRSKKQKRSAEWVRERGYLT